MARMRAAWARNSPAKRHRMEGFSLPMVSAGVFNAKLIGFSRFVDNSGFPDYPMSRNVKEINKLPTRTSFLYANYVILYSIDLATVKTI
jgi:hypothetical protein